MKNSTRAADFANLEIMDTTLSERIFGATLAVGEKLSIARALDSLGVGFVESPVPNHDAKELEFLKQFRDISKTKTSQISLALKNEERATVPEWAETVTVKRNCASSNLAMFARSPNFLEDNLKLAREVISSMKKQGKNIVFDALHFFDGFLQDTAYALTFLEQAVDAGASRIVLCDTKGGSLPEHVEKATSLVRSHFASRQDVLIGIRAHNDCGLALANTLAAVKAGANHAQTTINGVGERCGITDLCELLPLFVLKLGFSSLISRLPKEKQLLGLKVISEKVSLICGYSPPHQPFVSERAFAHVDPLCIKQVERSPEMLEVINPAFVGNSRKTGVDDASLILSEMWQLGLYTKEREVVARMVLARMRELEASGYKFDDAKASVHLLILEIIGSNIHPFQVARWEISTLKTIGGSREVAGTIEVAIGEGENQRKVSACAKGVGPIHAVDVALRKALDSEFPELRSLKLVSYSLNIVDSLSGTAAAARARTEFTDEQASSTQLWATISVSDDVLDASIRALVDGYRYKLIFGNTRERYAIPDWKVALSERYSERC